MKFFDVGQQATGFIAIGQFATGFFALGQVATGVVAIGQVARGVIAIGQLSFGFVTVGMLSFGLVHCVAMLGLGGLSGKGGVWSFVPRLAPRVFHPKTTTLEAIAASGEPGFVAVAVHARGDDVLFEQGGRTLPIEPITGLRAAARSLASHALPEGYAHVAPTGRGYFTCDRLVRKHDPSTEKPRSVFLSIVGVAVLVVGSYAFWEVFVIPWLSAILSSKA